MKHFKTPVFNKMYGIAIKAGEYPEPKRSDTIMAMLKFYGAWNPPEDWIPSDDELSFICDLRKQYSEAWKGATGLEVEEGKKLPFDSTWAEVDMSREEY